MAYGYGWGQGGPGAPQVTGSQAQPTTSRKKKKPPPNPMGSGWGGLVGQVYGQAPTPSQGSVYGNTPAVPPPSPEFLAAQASADYNIGVGSLTDTYQAGRIRGDYGYGADGNIDPSNPYSQAALWQKRYQEGKRGNLTSYAADGQLYSGALQNAQNAADADYLAGDARLKREMQDQLDQITLGGLARYGQYGAQLDQAAIDDLLAKLGLKR